MGDQSLITSVFSKQCFLWLATKEEVREIPRWGGGEGRFDELSLALKMEGPCARIRERTFQQPTRKQGPSPIATKKEFSNKQINLEADISPEPPDKNPTWLII